MSKSLAGLRDRLIADWTPNGDPNDPNVELVRDVDMLIEACASICVIYANTIEFTKEADGFHARRCAELIREMKGRALP